MSDAVRRYQQSMTGRPQDMTDPTTGDRQGQARAEADQRSPHDPEGYTTSEARGEFRAGVEWADANPKPRTITRKELNMAMLRAPRGSGAAGVLAQLGIEVEDNDE